jgi:hypothetical protein
MWAAMRRVLRELGRDRGAPISGALLGVVDTVVGVLGAVTPVRSRSESAERRQRWVLTDGWRQDVNEHDVLHPVIT